MFRIYLLRLKIKISNNLRIWYNKMRQIINLMRMKLVSLNDRIDINIIHQRKTFKRIKLGDIMHYFLIICWKIFGSLTKTTTFLSIFKFKIVFQALLIPFVEACLFPLFIFNLRLHLISYIIQYITILFNFR
jgi:hypothetical protein